MVSIFQLTAFIRLHWINSDIIMMCQFVCVQVMTVCLLIIIIKSIFSNIWIYQQSMNISVQWLVLFLFVETINTIKSIFSNVWM